jgi:hypothetical protein
MLITYFICEHSEWLLQLELVHFPGPQFAFPLKILAGNNYIPIEGIFLAHHNMRMVTIIMIPYPLFTTDIILNSSLIFSLGNDLSYYFEIRDSTS